MFPTLLKIGPVALHSYGLMIAIGFLLAVHLARRDAKKHGIDPRLFSEMAFQALLLGVLGTRVLHILMYPSAYSWNDPIGWVAIWNGGLVFQGALPLVILYVWYALRKCKLPFWSTTDLMAPYIPLGHALGRIGCFLNGCCYGKRTDLPWGVPFPRVPWDLAQAPTGSPAYLDHCQRYSELSYFSDRWSYPVHPTQLYSVVALLGICALLLLLRKKWHPFGGFTLPLYLTLYGAFRFFVEFLRGDHNPTHLGALSDQQIFSLLFIATGVIIFLLVRAWDRRHGVDKATANH